ncbi:MAG: T9SS type A sorting domain-containing protein [candidate division Zixibacteria bacterium]|nr:T9SS type A sorting domain-containing protein [candidate division Zixibacteria bacterium]
MSAPGPALLIAVITVAGVIICSTAQAQNFSIVNGVFGNGGSTGPGTSYQIFGTLGQPAVGKVSNAEHSLQSGVGHATYGIRWTDVKVEDEYESSLPKDYRLDQNYPNPFNPSTTIRFALPKHVLVTLTVYNLLGQTVSTLVEGTLSPGEYQITLDATDLPTGLYLYRLRAGEYTQSRKLVLLK